jgi:hypothetical protein
MVISLVFRDPLFLDPMGFLNGTAISQEYDNRTVLYTSLYFIHRYDILSPTALEYYLCIKSWFLPRENIPRPPFALHTPSKFEYLRLALSPVSIVIAYAALECPI